MRLRFTTCRFDTDRRQLVRDGTEQHLSRKAFELLSRLIEARPNVVGKRELMDGLWPETFVSEANLAVLISEIRAAIGDSARAPAVIRTHHGVGYAFVADVGELPPSPEHPRPGPLRVLVVGDRRIALLPGTVSVGRDRECDVVLEHPSVSRRHALLHVAGPFIEVEDLGSKNGTFIDGVPVSGRAELGGQAVAFGSVSCRILTEGGPDPTTLTVAPRPEGGE